MPIDTAVVLAAGSGTRLNALHGGAYPKEMLQIGGKFVIDHIISTLAFGGVKRVYVVISDNKDPIVRFLRDGAHWNIEICYLFQNFVARHPGLATAIQCAENFVNQDFICAFGDSFYWPKDFLREMIERHKKSDAIVTLNLIERDDPRSCGVVKLNKNNEVTQMMEKPLTLEIAKPFKLPNGKYLTIAGVMCLSPLVFDYIKRTKPGAKNEVQITDTIGTLLRDGYKVMGYYKKNLFFRDVGDPQNLEDADVFFVNRIHNKGGQD